MTPCGLPTALQKSCMARASFEGHEQADMLVRARANPIESAVFEHGAHSAFVSVPSSPSIENLINVRSIAMLLSRCLEPQEKESNRWPPVCVQNAWPLSAPLCLPHREGFFGMGVVG